jgi:class 3 adenylate cyclase
MSAERVTELAASHGWTWSLEKTRQRLEEAAATYPTGTMKVSGVKEKIGKTTLGVSNTKRVDGASIFADVDGFTGYIDGLSLDGDDLVKAARAFHVLRGVMRDTAVRDFGALRVQYQGDRMQSLAYLPLDDAQQAALDAVKLAAALNSVADLVVPTVVDPAAVKRLAIGLAWGEVLVSKIGEHDHRDVVTIGISTAEAASIQQRLEGGVIGISSALHNLLTGSVCEAFKFDENARAWVATDLQYDDLMLLIQSDVPERALGVIAGATLIGSRDDQRKEPLKPWYHD